MFPQQQNTQSQRNEQGFDEKPIGQGQKMPDISEYPPDFNTNDLNLEFKAQPLPLQKRVHSKVWKIRKQAFQQLLTDVSQNPSSYQQYMKDTVKFITDSTLVCQEKALKILLKYMQSCNSAIDDPKPIIKALMEKCLVVEKGEVLCLATEIMFWFMDHHQQLLLNEVNENILNKNPKISASILAFLQKLLNNYGAKKLKQFQEFGKNFTLMSSSVRPVAKQQTINLFKEMYRWMGDLALGFNMHPEVKDEVLKFAKAYVKQPMMIKRGLNEDQRKGKKPVIQNMEDQQNEEPQDILANYDSRWVDKVLQQPKWKDKKGHLDEFIKKTQIKNIIARQNTHYITLIKRLIVENNINLLQCGFKVVKNLCKGLKKNFSQPCKVILQLIFSKLRDTKTIIVQEAQQTLESMMNCLTLEDMIEDIRKGLNDKAPNMRLQTLIFVQKMSLKRNKKMMPAFKTLTIQIVDLSQDGSSQVRDKALDVLCKLKSSYGFGFFGDKLKKLPAKKLQTIKNYIDPNSNAVQQQLQRDRNNNNMNEESFSKFSKIGPSQNINQSQKSQPNSLKNSMINEQQTTTGTGFQLQSSSQNVRIQSYQNILQKSPQIIYQQLVEGFQNRMPMYKQSNPFILRLIMNCVKKSAHSSIGKEHMELLMHHDWKKCKSMLTQFIQNNKLNLQALEYVKNMGVLAQPQTQNNKKLTYSNPQKLSESETNSHGNSIHISSTNASHQNANIQSASSLKYFYSCLHNLIPKMSNPDPVIRLQAAQSAIQILHPIQNGALNDASTQPSPAVSQAISQFFNVLKFRIQDSNEEIANSYINLITEMLSKGFLTKYRTPGRLLISMLMQKINNTRLINLEYFIQQMNSTYPNLLWQHLATQICKQNVCIFVLNIIKKNNQSFFKNADQKSYMLPLLTCISKDIQPIKCSQLLDQIVEINGEHSLQKLVKESKLVNFNVEAYLKKWNIAINGQSGGNEKSKLSNLMISGSSFPASKLERLNSETENVWPMACSATNVIKMINQMISIGEPFQTLALPTLMSEHQLSIVGNLSNNIIEDYSDVLCRWIYWRVHLEYQPKNFQVLFSLITRIVSLGFELHESQIITLLSSLVVCLNLYKSLYIKQICRINQYLNQHPLYKEKSFRFWINSFNDPTSPVDEILHIMINSCPEMIPSEMVTLARYPAIVRNKQFNEYLRMNYTQKLLTVYGFKLPDLSKINGKQLISESIGDDRQALSEIECKYFVELFQRLSSNQLIDKIVQQTYEIPNQFVMETHLKIMHSIIVPYLHRELSFINVYNYFKYVQKIIMSINCSSFLVQLVRTLAYFLIDLDETKLENYSEMLKTINKLLLILLEISDTKHILEVLFIIMKQELRRNGNIKLLLLLPKCMGKVVKNPIFTSQYLRQPHNHDTLMYIITELASLISTFDIGEDTSIMRTIKNLLNQIMLLFPHSIAIFQDISYMGDNVDMSQNMDGSMNVNIKSMGEKGYKIVRELIESRLKQNKNNTTSSTINTSDNLSYSQSKDIKNSALMVKSLRPPPIKDVSASSNKSSLKEDI